MFNQKGLDVLVEGFTRGMALRYSRRSFVSKLGRFLSVGFFLPLLPVDRFGPLHAAAQDEDDQACDYWRYCAVDGNLCSCCGGSSTVCPPGTSKSPTSWVGTCLNPTDKQLYLVSYHDCCGKSPCQRCSCVTSEGELPPYRQQRNSDIVWCFGAKNMAYHCTGATVIGKAG